MTYTGIFTIARALITAMFEEYPTLSKAQASKYPKDRWMTSALAVLAEGQHLDPSALFDIARVLADHEIFKFWDGGGVWVDITDDDGNIILPEAKLKEMYLKQLEGNAIYAARQGR